MGPVGVADEPGVQRLDALQPLWAEIGGVLGGRDTKVRMPAHPEEGEHLQNQRRERA
jgi:hypothetical protein